MCFRYTIDESVYRQVEELVDVVSPSILNAGMHAAAITPALPAPVISLTAQGLCLSPKIFGYPPAFYGKKSRFVYNARSETVLEKNMFHEGICHHRAVIPAAAFNEMDPERRLFGFRHPDASPLYLAGFFDIRTVTYKNGKILQTGFIPDPADHCSLAGMRRDIHPEAGDLPCIEMKNLPCFIILTTVPNEAVKQVHSRMPVIIEKSEIADWLTGISVREILGRSCDTDLTVCGPE